MIRLLAFVIASLLPLGTAFAAEISEFDIATYALVRQDGQASGMEMRLSKAGGRWVLEGKENGGPWRDISCERACEYRASTADETGAYLAAFPPEMHMQFDIACIQNTASAFCRVTKKDDASKGGYALLALGAGKPRPVTLRRLTSPGDPRTGR